MSARDIAQALNDRAEDVCRHYLSAGRRNGSYWCVGDIDNTPGRSLVVNLRGPHQGRWIDNATGEKGDLLDLIRLALGLDMRGAMEEAERFLGRSFRDEPRPTFNHKCANTTSTSHLNDSARRESNTDPRSINVATDEAARLRKAASKLRGAVPIWGTKGQTYIEARHGAIHPHCDALRFHPDLWHGWTQTSHPALIGIITDFRDAETFLGVVAIYLNADGTGKAGVEPAKPTWGPVRGGVVRLVPNDEIDTRINVCEGVETGCSLFKQGWQVWAALGAKNLGRLPVLDGTPDLGVFADHDISGTGQQEAARLAERWSAAGGWAAIYTPPEPGKDWADIAAEDAA